MTTRSTVSQAGLAAIIRLIVDLAQPARIVLFGSAARHEMGSNSDVDLLVIRAGAEDRGRVLGDISVALHGVGQALDVILVTPAEVERDRDTPARVIAPRAAPGREVDHAAAVHA
jgi:predicted nucleotidyltransferase